MTTPDGLSRKFFRLSSDLETRIPAAGLLASANIVAGAARAGANRGFPPGGAQIKIKPPRKRFGNATVTIVGYGFAVLAEHGSWKHPAGWDIFPKGLTNSLKVGIKSGRSRHGSSLHGIEQKALRQARRLGYRRIMLGDIETGMAATFAHHPPQKPRPFVEAATAATAPACGATYDRVVLGAMASVFTG